MSWRISPLRSGTSRIVQLHQPSATRRGGSEVAGILARQFPSPLVGEGQGGGSRPEKPAVIDFAHGPLERSISPKECDRRRAPSLVANSAPAACWPKVSAPGTNWPVHCGFCVLRAEIGYRGGRRPTREPNHSRHSTNLVVGEPRILGIAVLEQRGDRKHGWCDRVAPQVGANRTPPPQPSPTPGGGREVANISAILSGQLSFICDYGAEQVIGLGTIPSPLVTAGASAWYA